ncbi:MAG: peroxiredoxin-like family protein [Myxococcota bacterium]|nr:peroxiredoxin-like family protein [Myxococcota bacterium]
MIEAGTEAPDFEASGLTDERIRLSSRRGAPVWLAFFRFASCPLCNYRVHEMLERWEMFADRDFHLLAVFQSPAHRLREFVAKQSPPFQLIADPEMELYEKYGLEASFGAALSANVFSKGLSAATTRGIKLLALPDGPALRVPADFFIDRRGVVQRTYQGRDIADHVPLEEADAFLRAQGA